MNSWNRLFVVVAVCWAITAPFLIVEQANQAPLSLYGMCSTSAYNRFGSSSSTQLDMDRYRSEMDRCSDHLKQLVGVQTIVGAMFGMGERLHGLVAWALILAPLALLWVIGWVIGRTVMWVAAGFRRRA